jgi:hypothetical protein
MIHRETRPSGLGEVTTIAFPQEIREMLRTIWHWLLGWFALCRLVGQLLYKVNRWKLKMRKTV